MVPGGESFEVLKMPYNWKSAPEKIRQHPIIISRFGDGFNRNFKLTRYKGPVPAEDQAKGLALLTEMIADRLERDQPKVFIAINGHYHQLRGPAQGEALMSVAPIFSTYQQDNADPRVTLIDTLTPTHAIYPLGIRSDHMHASTFANYIEGRLIVEALCACDGIPMPPEISPYVDEIISKAADLRDAFHVTAPMPEDPSVTYAMGETIDISWEVVDPAVTGIYVMLHRLGHDDYYLSDRIDVSSQKTGNPTMDGARTLTGAG